MCGYFWICFANSIAILAILLWQAAIDRFRSLCETRTPLESSGGLIVACIGMIIYYFVNDRDRLIVESRNRGFLITLRIAHPAWLIESFSAYWWSCLYYPVLRSIDYRICSLSKSELISKGDVVVVGGMEEYTRIEDVLTARHWWTHSSAFPGAWQSERSCESERVHPFPTPFYWYSRSRSMLSDNQHGEVVEEGW